MMLQECGTSALALCFLGDAMWDGYKTERWRRLRERILRRDGYMSREAKRYGRTVEATIVHHCWPADEFPQYAWEAWNLISVTDDEHRSFHNPDGSLTDLGAGWKERSRPPRPAP